MHPTVISNPQGCLSLEFEFALLLMLAAHAKFLIGHGRTYATHGASYTRCATLTIDEKMKLFVQT